MIIFSYLCKSKTQRTKGSAQGQTDLDSKYATCVNVYFCLLLVLVYRLPTDESLCYSISNLSSSHEINDKMVCALQKALELFPKDSLSAIEVQQKVQYETGLKVTSKPCLIRVTAIEKRPWEMAETMRREPT